MNINKISITEEVINRVCVIRDELARTKEYKELQVKYRGAAQLLEEALPKDKFHLFQDMEEHCVAGDVFLQDRIYVQGLLDGMKAADAGQVLKVDDIAKFLRIGRVQAYNLVRTEGFPKIMVGKRIVIPRQAFENWLNTTALKSKQEVIFK